MNIEYLIRIENLSKKGITKLENIEKNHKNLREALSSNPEETFGMTGEEIEESWGFGK